MRTPTEAFPNWLHFHIEEKGFFLFSVSSLMWSYIRALKERFLILIVLIKTSLHSLIDIKINDWKTSYIDCNKTVFPQYEFSDVSLVENSHRKPPTFMAFMEPFCSTNYVMSTGKSTRWKTSHHWSHYAVFLRYENST